MDTSVMEIVLRNGLTTLVDDEDRSLLDGKYLYAQFDKKSGVWYAYAKWKLNGVRFRTGVGRIILGLEKGDKREAEHIDPNATLDNRRSNLRIATRSQNNANRRMRKDNTSGYKGVTKYLQGPGWRAQIMLNKKSRVLGVFETKEKAYEAYCEAAKHMHGEFARPEMRVNA